MTHPILTALLALTPRRAPAEYLTRLPSLHFPSRANLPECAGIYFVMVEPGFHSATLQILYIGRSRNLRSRWRAHHRLPDLERHPGARIYWMRVDDLVDDDALSALELWCIGHFRPRYNNAPVVNTWRERFAALLAHTRRVEAQNRALWAMLEDGRFA